MDGKTLIELSVNSNRTPGRARPVGAPFDDSKYHWRLDDQLFEDPAYEKTLKAGIVKCAHP